MLPFGPTVAGWGFAAPDRHRRLRLPSRGRRIAGARTPDSGDRVATGGRPRPPGPARRRAVPTTVVDAKD